MLCCVRPVAARGRRALPTPATLAAAADAFASLRRDLAADAAPRSPSDWLGIAVLAGRWPPFVAACIRAEAEASIAAASSAAVDAVTFRRALSVAVKSAIGAAMQTLAAAGVDVDGGLQQLGNAAAAAAAETPVADEADVVAGMNAALAIAGAVAVADDVPTIAAVVDTLVPACEQVTYCACVRVGAALRHPCVLARSRGKFW